MDVNEIGGVYFIIMEESFVCLCVLLFLDRDSGLKSYFCICVFLS